MSFTSWPFACLAIVTFGLYYLPALRHLQVAILLASSLYFYAFQDWRLLPLLVCTFLVSFHLVGSGRKAVAIGVAFNLAILAFFKYKFLFIDPASPAGEGLLGYLLGLPLPIGISFFVFHNISMLVDFHQRKLARPKLANAGVYIIFFPQLVSGPLNKARDFFPQVEPKFLRDVPFVSAARWIIGGYFLKLFCANNLNQLTSWMDPSLFRGVASGDRVLLLVLYSFQIFADFAGYSAIAIGVALLFGYRLPINFREPYLSASFSEFWTRWHISLSSWLRTYLYFPLGGNRHGRFRTYFNLMTVMMLGGLWHGAGLSYLVWGIGHGLCLVLERPLLRCEQSLYANGNRALSSVYRVVRIAVVFAAVTLLWLFFRLPQFSDALEYARGFGTDFRFSTNFYWYSLAYSAPVVLLHVFSRLRDTTAFRRIEPGFHGLLVFLSIIEAGPDSAFIYFQF